MKKGVLGMLLLGKLVSGAEPSYAGMLQRAREIFWKHHPSEESRQVNFMAGGIYLVPVCGGKRLFLSIFKNQLLSKTCVVTLKEGVFDEESISFHDSTSHVLDIEDAEERNRLIASRTAERIKAGAHQEEEISFYEFLKEVRGFEKEYGVARWIEIHGTPFPLKIHERVVRLRCLIQLPMERVILEVDLADFCDADAWSAYSPDLSVWKEGEPYISGCEVLAENGGGI